MRSDIRIINESQLYHIKAVEYVNSLYDINKGPKKTGMYFLDSLCQ